MSKTKEKIEKKLAGYDIVYTGDRNDTTYNEERARCILKGYGGVEAWIPVSDLTGRTKVETILKGRMCNYVTNNQRYQFLLSYHTKVNNLPRGYINISTKAKKTIEEFERKSYTDKEGKKKYRIPTLRDYSEATKVSLLCKNHTIEGYTSTNLLNLVQGKYTCPVCSTIEKQMYRYKDWSKLLFYIILFEAIDDPLEVFIKYGVSTEKIDYRYSPCRLVCESGTTRYKIKEVEGVWKMDTDLAVELESSLLGWMGYHDKKISFIDKWGGDTECVLLETHNSLGMPLIDRFIENAESGTVEKVSSDYKLSKSDYYKKDE